MARLQFEFTDERIDELDALVKHTNLRTRVQLFNAALSLFEWAVRQRENGRIIASIDEENGVYKELEMPGLPAVRVSEREAVKAVEAGILSLVPVAAQVSGVGSASRVAADYKSTRLPVEMLSQVDVNSLDELLELGATPKGRLQIAQKTGVGEEQVLEWVNRADLVRIQGVAEDYAELLLSAGVDTVPELAHRNPEHLHQRLQQVNQEKKIVRRLPSQQQITRWIDQAKELPRLIQY